MNDTDFEARLARALNVGVDERLGAERPAPPFRADAPTRTVTRHRGPRWNRTLLAAACIIAVVAGAFALVASRNSGNDKPVPPSTQSPSPTPSVRTHTVSVDAARLVLPAGWTARKLAGNDIWPTWCLEPASSHQGMSCAVTFSKIVKFNGDYDVNVDHDAGQGDMRQYCVPHQPRWTVESEERTLGGRPAEWRRFTIDCPDGTQSRNEQYLVDSLPGYFLRTTNDYGIDARVMTMVATRSRLPAQSSGAPLRLYDHGLVRKVRATADGVRVTLTRVVVAPGSTRPPKPRAGAPSVVYDVPAAAYRGGAAPKPGRTVTITSNGVKVTSVGDY